MAVTKYLVNNINDAVTESLSGLCYVYPQLELHVANKVVLTPHIKDQQNKVAVICGGGSGHEPFAAGFVGSGMLTASIAGSIFASPPVKHITHAINCVAQYNKAGILLIIPNYTGDCLNFGLALEKAKQTGINISEIIVGEDCSIPEKEQSLIGKRGLAGMVFIIKIAGALSERGQELKEVLKYVKIATDNMATYAIGLSACSLPGQGLMFKLKENEMEIGMGIHGEAGYERVKTKSAAELVEFMLQNICKELKLSKGDNVAMLINNFGALSQLEQGIVAYEAVKQLESQSIKPLRVYSGLLVTSLNSAGIHITLLKLEKGHKDIFLRCLDDTTNAPAWPGCVLSLPLTTKRTSFEEPKKKEAEKLGLQLSEGWQSIIKSSLGEACKNIIEKEGYLNELDRGCGDGDCGSTLRRLAMGIQDSIDNLPLACSSQLLMKLADIAEDTMGGTSGALYSLLLTTGAKELSYIKKNESYITALSRAFRSGINCMMKYSKAKPGDRTMLDALEPACKALEESLEAPITEIATNVITATWQGCETTKDMKARVGRASYVKEKYYTQKPDAGAYAVATWITALAGTIKDFQN